MADKTISARIRQKYDTASNWATHNPILLAGELGIEKDTGLIKIGDGTSRWSTLTYINDFGQANNAGIMAASSSSSETALQNAGIPLYVTTD